MVIGRQVLKATAQTQTHSGGTIVCSGEGCKVDFVKCCLSCKLVVSEGAHVELKNTQILPQHCDAIGMLIHGAGTSVKMIGGAIMEGLQGISVQEGALLLSEPNRELDREFSEHWAMEQLKVTHFGFSGIEVCGEGSRLELQFAELCGVPGHVGVHVHSNAKAVLGSVVVDSCHYGFKVNSLATAVLKRCHVESGARAGTFLQVSTS